MNLLVNITIIVSIVQQNQHGKIYIMNEYEYNCKYCSANFLTKKLPLNSTLIMDQRPQRKKTLPLRFQDLKIDNKIAKNIDTSIIFWHLF